MGNGHYLMIIVQNHPRKIPLVQNPPDKIPMGQNPPEHDPPFHKEGQNPPDCIMTYVKRQNPPRHNPQWTLSPNLYFHIFSTMPYHAKP